MCICVNHCHFDARKNKIGDLAPRIPSFVVKRFVAHILCEPPSGLTSHQSYRGVVALLYFLVWPFHRRDFSGQQREVQWIQLRDSTPQNKFATPDVSSPHLCLLVCIASLLRTRTDKTLAKEKVRFDANNTGEATFTKAL